MNCGCFKGGNNELGDRRKDKIEGFIYRMNRNNSRLTDIIVRMSGKQSYIHQTSTNKHVTREIRKTKEFMSIAKSIV